MDAARTGKQQHERMLTTVGSCKGGGHSRGACTELRCIKAGCLLNESDERACQCTCLQLLTFNVL